MLRLYDTMTRSIQPLEAADKKSLRMYCCGPTVYGPAHIGNFRTFVLQDVLRRTIEAHGLATTHVRNITDVDDKTIRGAREAGVPLQEFTRKWTDAFQADGAELNLLPPHHEPAATDHIQCQIHLVQQLVDQGVAYPSEDGSVYFRVSAWPDYGKLSRLKERELRSGASGSSTRQDADEYDKESVSDFVLWKAHKEEDGEVRWPSPWGEGRPGWHLECSAMSHEFLGDSFDLHGGGIDLCFPHHENEIAQSCAGTSGSFARHWFHTAHLTVEGEKMSKSLGNLFTLNDVKERGFTAMDLRYVLLSGQYRQSLNYSWNTLEAARSALQRLARLRQLLAESSGHPELAAQPPQAPASCSPDDTSPFDEALQALADDLNTPRALGALFTAAKALENADPKPDEAKLALKGLDRLLFALGLHPQAMAPESSIEAPPEMLALAQSRWEAKQAKDFTKADALRADLEENGWLVKDTKDGFELSRK